ncbi:hypothetical protein Tco_1047409 [Tanacetum coccineum]
MDDDYVSALACLRDTIPSFDFSVFTNKDTAPSKAQQTLASALFSEMVKDIKVHFDMTVRQKAVFECLRAPHAQDFLLAIPIDGLGQHMSPVEYRTILKYRLMIPLFPDDAICPVCRKACLDSFGEHACRISAKKEAPVNFLTDPSDGRSTLRPADVLVFEWVGGKHACVDLTGVSPLVGLSSRGFTVGQAALKAASCKVAKHEKACIKNQHVFIPFAFDTFGFLAPEAVELLTRVQRVMNSNVMTPRSANVVFNRIGFAIQKGLAAQLIKMVAFLAEAVAYHTLLAAYQSFMTGSLLKDVVASQTLDGTNQRFILSEVLRKNKTEPEAKDGSDTEDDDEDEEEPEAVEPEDDAGDEDFSGEEEADDEEGDPDENPATNGDQEDDDDDDNDDDDDGNDDDDDDGDDDEEEVEEEDDDEDEPPAKKRK